MFHNAACRENRAKQNFREVNNEIREVAQDRLQNNSEMYSTEQVII